MMPTPVQSSRQLPLTPVNTNVNVNPLKRANPGKSDARPQSRPRVMLTPPPSDGHIPSSDDFVFKIPAFPQRVRLMTPSSSTVAASSSPAPTSSPNAPRKRSAGSSGSSKKSSKTVGEVINVEIQQGWTYVFGRHRHHDAHTNSTTTLPSTISSSLSQSSNPIRTIFLPRQASHASRLHAVVEYVSETAELRVVVAGQNGIKVRSDMLKRRVAKGENVVIKRQDQIKLDFYGCTALLRLPEVATHQDPMSLFSPSSSPVRRDLGSLPPSSPPLGPISEDGNDNEREEEREPADRSSSPLSPISEKASDLPELEVKAEMLDEIVAQPSPSRPSRPVSRTVSPVKETLPVPSDLDLPALIASTVVFSGSSKLSQPDLVKHMLEVSPISRIPFHVSMLTHIVSA